MTAAVTNPIKMEPMKLMMMKLFMLKKPLRDYSLLLKSISSHLRPRHIGN